MRSRPLLNALVVGTVVAAALFTMGIGFAHKSRCASADWTKLEQYALFCYSDLFPLFTGEQLEGDRFPYLDACEGFCDEYPPGIMLAMRAAANPADTSDEFFFWNAGLLALCGAVAAFLLALTAGKKAFFFALAPSLALYSFLNWDLLAIVLMVAAAWAFLRNSDFTAGTMIGLGAATKLFPIILAPPFIAHRLRSRRYNDVAAIAVTAAAAWALPNLYFFLRARDSWLTFYRFSTERGPTYESLWSVVCGGAEDLAGTQCSVPFINQASLIAFVVASAIVYFLTRRVAPDFPRWTFVFPLMILFIVTNKVGSPQYALWLTPWFALVLPSVRWFIAFSLSDIAVFFTEFSFLGTIEGLAGFTEQALHGAVTIKTVVLILLIVVYVRRGGRPAQLRTTQSPAPA